MFTKILVALDGSDISMLAFNRALNISKQDNAELHLAYVVEKGMASIGPADGSHLLLLEKVEAEGREMIEKQAEIAKNEGVNVFTHILNGHAGEEITNLSSKIDCDLLVVGSLGKGKIDRLLLGSVSSFVVKSAKTNILVVRK